MSEQIYFTFVATDCIEVTIRRVLITNNLFVHFFKNYTYISWTNIFIYDIIDLEACLPSKKSFKIE